MGVDSHLGKSDYVITIATSSYSDYGLSFAIASFIAQRVFAIMTEDLAQTPWVKSRAC